MRYQKQPQPECRGKRHTIAAVAASSCALFATPAYADGVALAQSSSWVTATLVSVAAVLALWVTSMTLFVVLRRARWLSAHRHSRLGRILQVAFGALFLMAVVMPYLAMHHPMLAAGLLVIATLFAVGSRSRSHDFGGRSSS